MSVLTITTSSTTLPSIRVHLELHGAPIAEVHGLHELDIVGFVRAFDCDGGLAVLDGQVVFTYILRVCSFRRKSATETGVG